MILTDLLFAGKVSALEQELKANPNLANEPLPLPDNPALALPLHRVCDAVFFGNVTEETGVKMANILLSHGADLNKVQSPGEDSPLTTAASLSCDQLALLYIDRGARIDHPGAHGGTALHWAAWCGRDVIVARLLAINPAINQRCTSFKATPLFWAIHGHRHSENKHHQFECAQLLLAHGADPTMTNIDGDRPEKLLFDHETQLKSLFK